MVLLGRGDNPALLGYLLMLAKAVVARWRSAGLLEAVPVLTTAVQNRKRNALGFVQLVAILLAALLRSNPVAVWRS